jgi:hypothetical protein
MKVTFLGTTGNSGSCPDPYATDHGTCVVQGSKVTDPEVSAVLRERGLPDHETAAEIPSPCANFAPEET